MTGVESLKAFTQAAIGRRRDWIVDIAKRVLQAPEIGFREFFTTIPDPKKITRHCR